MIAAWLLVASFGSGDYSAPATPLGRLVPALGQAFGGDWRVSPALANEVMVVDVSAVSADDLRARIAQAAGGQWRAEGNAWVLEWNEVQARQELAAWQAERAKKLDEAIARDLLGAPDETYGPTQINRLIESVKSTPSDTVPDFDTADLPGSRLGKRILKALSGKDLALIPIGSRLTFSTSPNRRQRPLGSAAGNLLNRFRQEHAQLMAAVRSLPEDQRLSLEAFAGGTLAQTPTKINVLAVCLPTEAAQSMGAPIMLSVRVIGPNGENLSESSQIITPEVKLPAAEKRENVTLTEAARLYDGWTRRETNRATLKPEFQRLFLDPLQRDPLGYAHSETLIGWAREKKLDLVAVLPDSLIDRAAGRPAQALPIALKSTEEGGWWIARPHNPTEARLTRTPRKELATLMAKCAAGEATLDDFGRFALATPDPIESSLGYALLNAASETTFSPLDLQSANLLRFWAALGADTRNQITNRPVSIASLPAGARGWLEKLMFQDASLSDMMVSSPSGDAMIDPNELLPNGLPGGAALVIEASPEEVAVDAKNAFMSYSANDLGALLAQRARPDLMPWAQEIPMPTEFRLGKRVGYLVSVRLAETASQSWALTDTQPAKGAGRKLADLPSAFRDAVESAKKEFLANLTSGAMASPPIPVNRGSGIPPL